MLNLESFTDYEITLKNNRLLVGRVYQHDLYNYLDPKYFGNSPRINYDKEPPEEYVRPDRGKQFRTINNSIIGKCICKVRIPLRDHIQKEQSYIFGFHYEDIIFYRGVLWSYDEFKTMYRIGAIPFFNIETVGAYMSNNNIKFPYSVKEMLIDGIKSEYKKLVYCVVICHKRGIRFKKLEKEETI